MVTGGDQEFYAPDADASVASIPDAERLVFAGQSHVAEPRVVAPTLERFSRS